MTDIPPRWAANALPIVAKVIGKYVNEVNANNQAFLSTPLAWRVLQALDDASLLAPELLVRELWSTTPSA